jgi:hypothetical protein
MVPEPGPGEEGREGTERMSRTLQHLSHWGALEVTVEGDDVVAVAGHPDDPNPTR